MPTKRRRFTVNIPHELDAAVERRAKELNRSVANYLEWLVASDLHPGVNEDAVPYGVTPPEPLKKTQTEADAERASISAGKAVGAKRQKFLRATKPTPPAKVAAERH